jgi:hypothetical protein
MRHDDFIFQPVAKRYRRSQLMPLIAAALAVTTSAAALSSCARPAKADKTSEKLVKRVQKGNCTQTSGLPAASVTNWTKFCNDLGSYLPEKFSVPSFTSTSKQTGEVGWIYNSSAEFTNKGGGRQKLTFEYDGAGYLANKPQLTKATSSMILDVVGKPITINGLWSATTPGREELLLVQSVLQSLSKQQCDELQQTALVPLNGGSKSSFSDACKILNKLFAGREFSTKPTYQLNEYSLSSAAAAPSLAANPSSDQVLNVILPDLTVQLILDNGKWYLNGIRVNRQLFTYKF